MKVLVLGANGMAGHTIAIYFKERGYDVTGYSMSPFPYCDNIIGNAFEINEFKSMIVEGKYDLIINCIGMLNQTAENNQAQAVYLNSYLPHFIADVTGNNMQTKLIHMSTDCVFAGNTGPYYEDSLPDGRTFYDRSKAMGEVVDNKNLTFRNSIIGPDMNVEGIGLFNWFMKQTGTINGFTEALWTGVTTLTLAKAMEIASQENLTGLYNLVNNESISKYDLLVLFNKHIKEEGINIIPSNSLNLDKTLKSRRNDFSFVVPSYEQQIVEMKDWIFSHKNLYPHYFLN